MAEGNSEIGYLDLVNKLLRSNLGVKESLNLFNGFFPILQSHTTFHTQHTRIIIFNYSNRCVSQYILIVIELLRKENSQKWKITTHLRKHELFDEYLHKGG